MCHNSYFFKKNIFLNTMMQQIHTHCTHILLLLSKVSTDIVCILKPKMLVDVCRNRDGFSNVSFGNWCCHRWELVQFLGDFVCVDGARAHTCGETLFKRGNTPKGKLVTRTTAKTPQVVQGRQFLIGALYT